LEALKITTAKAEKQKLEVLPGGFVLASGDNPANDSYRIEAGTELSSISSLRLEATRHPSMTKGGLARSDSGNFVLTRFQVAVLPAGATEPQVLKFASAEASYEQGHHKITTTVEEGPGLGGAV
jgi:hypothetical protein